MKLVTRAQLGWPASAAPTQTTAKGVKVHYEGTAVSAKLLDDHALCIAEWKAIRASHLANTAEGYSDVAYNYAACPHGYLLEGRGLRKRTGANGNQTLNAAHYAIVGLVGSSGLTKPTDAMLHAIRDGIELLRANGAGAEIKGHRDGYATACPGADLYAWVQKGAPRPTTSTEETDMQLSDQVKLGTWVPKAWPTDSGLQDGQIQVNTALGSAYGYSRQAAENSRALLAQVAALTAVVTKLAEGGGLDAAEVQAAAEAGAKAALAQLGDALDSSS